MKRLVLTIAVVLGLSMTTFAQGGGLFHRGNTTEQNDGFMSRADGKFPGLPGEHGGTDHADADELPLGTGIAILLSLGGCYAMSKKNRK